MLFKIGDCQGAEDAMHRMYGCKMVEGLWMAAAHNKCEPDPDLHYR